MNCVRKSEKSTGPSTNVFAVPGSPAAWLAAACEDGIDRRIADGDHVFEDVHARQRDQDCG